MKSILRICILNVSLCAAYSATETADAQTLDKVKARGNLICGVSQGLPGFSNPDNQGRWTGIDVDFCRGISAAIFNDADKVTYVGLPAKDRFTSLQSGSIDVLSHDTTWTMSRDVGLGINFTGIIYYDGQGFMARKSLGATSAQDLSGASFCTQTGTTTELNLADFFASLKKKYELVSFATGDEALKAYEAGRCDVYTNDISSLHAQRLKTIDPLDHVILEDVISKEPLGPAVRNGDDQWFDIAKWVLIAMVNAEELEITSANASLADTSPDIKIQRFTGRSGKYGSGLGLSDDWAFRIIKLVGNYREIYERNLGEQSQLKIPRGQNKLWLHGGLQYAPPMQ